MNGPHHPPPGLVDVTPEEAVAMQAHRLTPAQRDLFLREINRKPDWWRDLTEDGFNALVTFTVTAAHLNFMDRMFAEDLIKDLPNRASVTAVNRLGTRFVPHIQNEYFDTIHFAEYSFAIDALLGAELEWFNKVRRGYYQLRLERASRGVTGWWPIVRALLFLSLIPLVGILLVLGLFISGVNLFHEGAFVDFSKLTDGSVKNQVTNEAIWALVKGSGCIIASLLFLKPVEAVLRPITSRLGFDLHWLTGFGRKIIVPACIGGFILVCMILFGAELKYRLFLFALFLLVYALGVWLIDLGFVGEYQLRSLKLNTIIASALGVGLVMGIIVLILDINPIDKSRSITTTVSTELERSLWAQSIALALVGFALSYFIVIVLHKAHAKQYGTTLYVPRWSLADTAIVLFFTAAGFGYPLLAKHNPDPFEKPAVSETKRATDQETAADAGLPDPCKDNLSPRLKKRFGCD